jgi:hypothetical protein
MSYLSRVHPIWGAKRLEPPHDIFGSHFQYVHILGILGQHDIALVHCDQKSGSFVRIQVAADRTLRLPPTQSRRYDFLPSMEHLRQVLAETFV